MTLDFVIRSWLNFLVIARAVTVKRSRRKIANVIQTALAVLALLLGLILFLAWRLADKIAG